jgi:hypothetical protein
MNEKNDLAYAKYIAQLDKVKISLSDSLSLFT